MTIPHDTHTKDSPVIGKVFVSHSSADKPFVDRLVVDLRRHSIAVWYDKFDLNIGDSVPGSLNQALADAKYFAIVLSKAAVASSWVREELNAALMKQVAFGGTFILPLLIEDCDVPPLLAHRRHADFRRDYDGALSELLALWGLDASACASVQRSTVCSWPDTDISDAEFVYLHSTRFDKFFRMSCSLDWTADRTIDYLINTLKLPWNAEVPELGMKWSFRYGLHLDEKGIGLDTSLRQAGAKIGSVLKINISGVYQDLYEKELKDAFGSGKFYLMTPELMRREQWLREQVASRKLLSRDQLKDIADSCFSHV